MTHPITDGIRQLKRTARRLALLRAVGLTFTVALTAAMAAMLLDYWMRWEDPLTRWLLTAAWLGCSAYACWTWWGPLVRVPWSEQTIARLVERQFPQLTDQLSSAMAFLTQSEGDASLGSKQLVRNVIAETTTALTDLPLRRVVDGRPAGRALGYLAATLLVAAMLLGANRVASSQAAARLVAPWRPHPWPRVHHLAFMDAPDRIAEGGDLRLQLVDQRGRLPSQVDFLLWPQDAAEDDAEVIPMVRVDGRMVIERDNVRQPFRYRAVGGDDHSMPWRTMQVVPPPKVLVTRTTLIPPGYTGWIPETRDGPLGSLRVLEGSQVAFTGEADRLLSAVMLQTWTPSAETTWRGEVRQTHYQVPAPGQSWVIDVATEYHLRFQAQDGTSSVNPDRWSVQVVPDAPPLLTLTAPEPEELITRSAVLLIRCAVQDDLAMKRVELRYARSDASQPGEIAIPLYEGPEVCPPAEIPGTLPPPAARQMVAYDWALQSWNLADGTTITFHLRGEDYKQQVGQTNERRLQVVSEAELLDRVGQRQSLVLADLQRHLRQQQEAESQVRVTQAMLQSSSGTAKSATDQLQSAVIKQRQVNAALAGADAEIATELRRLHQVLDRSRIGENDVRDQIVKTQQAISGVAEDFLEPALRAANTALGSLQIQPASSDDELPDAVPADVLPALAQSAMNQQSAIDALEQLLEDMSAWDDYRRFPQELSELLRQQLAITTDSQAVAARALAEQPALQAETTSRVTKAAARQVELARRLDRTLQQLARSQEKLAGSANARADMLSEALEVARQGAVSGTMRNSGRLLRELRFGNAASQQQTAARVLGEMLSVLGRKTMSREEIATGLDEVDRALQQLQTRQQGLENAFGQAKTADDPPPSQQLAEQQSELAEQAEDFQRRLGRLQANAAAKHTSSAATAARGATQAARQGDWQGAETQAQRAAEELARARQTLQATRQRTAAELRDEQFARLPFLLETLLTEQRTVLEALDAQVQLEVPETSDAAPAAAAVIAAQQNVRQTGHQIIPQADNFPAIVFALREAMRAMQGVIAALEPIPSWPRSRALADDATRQLERIAASLTQDDAGAADANTQSAADGAPAGQGDGSPNGGPSIEAQLAQLKLLRELQLDLNRETQERAAMLGDTPDPTRPDEVLVQLAARQGRLEQLLRQLHRQLRETAQDE